MRPSPRRTGAALLLLGALLLAAPRAATADAFDALAKTVREELKSDLSETRLHGMSLAAGAKDPRAVELLVVAVGEAVNRRGAVAKAQVDAQTSLEEVLGKIEKANSEPTVTPQEIEKYNRKMRKYQNQRDEIYTAQRRLAVDSMRSAAEVETGVASLGALLKSLPPADGDAAVERLAGLWFAKAGPEERERFLSVLAAAATLPAARVRLRAFSMDATQHWFLRAIALRGRGQPGDAEALSDLTSLLGIEIAQWPVIEAAIDGLRRMHKQGAIAPLIEFLGRKDTGKLKRSAWKALRSLTGQTHGPYEGPWREWWKESEAKFFMPPRPVDTVAQEAADQGATFFGEPLASDRVFFVLDISKSMLDLAHPGAAGARGKERRIDVLRREFAGTVDQLGEVGLFNIVLFGSGLVTFSNAGVVPDAVSKARAKKFLEETEPVGGTNIHDALETAFRLATPKAAGDKAPYDTIVFLTDGTPTSGKLQEPDQILAAVARWNAANIIAIRVVGIGECDEAFLKKLAEQNKGTFSKR
jgi:VWA domain-containing protein